MSDSIHHVIGNGGVVPPVFIGKPGETAGPDDHTIRWRWINDEWWPSHRAEEVRVTSETGGQKGDKLARFDLLPAGPLWKVAELYGAGARKYADRNWEAGYDWHLSYAAMMRHAWSFWGGEDVDPETQCHHLASVVFHALALLEYGETHPEFDDRPKR